MTDWRAEGRPDGRPMKIPQSVLVLIYTPALDVLLIRRADTSGDYWQSVTGSRKTLTEPLATTAAREVREETGLVVDVDGRLCDWHQENTYPLDPRWSGRFAPGVTHNVEHVFSLCVPRGIPVHLNPREHTDAVWLPWSDAAQRCSSSTNARACRELPHFVETHSTC